MSVWPITANMPGEIEGESCFREAGPEKLTFAQHRLEDGPGT